MNFSTAHSKHHLSHKVSLLTMGLLTLWVLAAGNLVMGAPSISDFHNRAGQRFAVSGDVIELTGSGLAGNSTAVAQWPLPFALSSVQVTCNGFLAPILSVSYDSIRIQIPWETLGQAEALMQVTVNGISSAPYHIPMSEAAPAIIGVNNTGSISPGQQISMRAIGLGMRSLNPMTGFGPTTDSPGPVTSRMLVLVGGVPAPIVQTSLANSGVVQDDAGVEIVDAQIPFNVPSGPNIPVQIVIDNAQSAEYNVSLAAAPVQIVLNSKTFDVALGGSAALQGTVQGSADTALTWTIDNNQYSVYGTISKGSFVAARYTMPFPNWTLIRAVHSSGAFATALVRLLARDGVAYTIVPQNPIVAAGESVSFSLLRSDGTIVDNAHWFGDTAFYFSNTYTAANGYNPAEVTVSAGLPDLSNHVATTVIRVVPPRPQISGTTPGVGHIGEALTFSGDNLYAPTTRVWFTLADSSQISLDGEAADSYSNEIIGTTVNVPHGAVSGPVWLEFHSASPVAFRSSPLQLPILPRLRLHAARQQVSAGESEVISVAAPDVPGAWPVTWRADFGTVNSSGVFQAPRTVAEPTFARIWACLMANTECSTVIVEVLPFRIEPEAPVLNPGESVQLRAWQGSAEIKASWQAITKNVTMTSDGIATAGTGLFDSGVATVQATAGGTTISFNLAISGIGAVARAPEFYDWLGYDNNSPYGRQRLGVFPSAIAARGNWIYVLSRSIPLGSSTWLSVWLDAYRLDDRKRPVWIDSVEAPYMPNFFGTNLYIEDDTLWVAGPDGASSAYYPPNLLLRFDISNGRPVLKARQRFSGTPGGFLRKGFGFSVQSSGMNGITFMKNSQFRMTIDDHAAGSSRTVALDYSPVNQDVEFWGANGTSDWAAVMFFYPTQNPPRYETVIFDYSSDPARQITVLPSGGFNDRIEVMPGLLIVGPDVYKVAARNFYLASRLKSRFALDSDPVTRRLLVAPNGNFQLDGIRVVDLSDPFHPRVSFPTVHHSQFPSMGVLGPDYFVLARAALGPQAFDIYPIPYPPQHPEFQMKTISGCRSEKSGRVTQSPCVTRNPGMHVIDLFSSQPYRNALLVQDGYLYFTGYGVLGTNETKRIFEILDVSSEPYHTVSSADRPGMQHIGWAITKIGKYVYVGTDSETIVYDVSNVSSPVEVTVLPVQSVSFAVSGKYLYAGSSTATNTVLRIYDVSDPGKPQELGSIPLPDFAYELKIRNDLLAIAFGDIGLGFYSVADPRNPLLLKQIGGETWGVEFNGNLMFVAAATSGLIIYDMTDPLNPLFLSQTFLGIGDETQMTPSALSVTIDSRGIAFVCSAFKDARVYGFDIREPRRPRHIFEVPLGEGLDDVQNTAVWNNRLFVAGEDGALDISEPQNVGLYEVHQTYPGAVLPDRYNDRAPVSLDAVQHDIPRKALLLRQRFSGRR